MVLTGNPGCVSNYEPEVLFPDRVRRGPNSFFFPPLPTDGDWRLYKRLYNRTLGTALPAQPMYRAEATTPPQPRYVS